eukprot:gene8505-17539_t
MSSSDDAETGGSELDQEVTKAPEIWEAELLHLTAPSRMAIKFHENDGDLTMVEQPQAKLLWFCDRVATVVIPVAIAQMLGVCELVDEEVLPEPRPEILIPACLPTLDTGKTSSFYEKVSWFRAVLVSRLTVDEDGAMIVRILTLQAGELLFVYPPPLKIFYAKERGRRSEREQESDREPECKRQRSTPDTAGDTVGAIRGGGTDDASSTYGGYAKFFDVDRTVRYCQSKTEGLKRVNQVHALLRVVDDTYQL